MDESRCSATRQETGQAGCGDYERGIRFGAKLALIDYRALQERASDLYADLAAANERIARLVEADAMTTEQVPIAEQIAWFRECVLEEWEDAGGINDAQRRAATEGLAKAHAVLASLQQHERRVAAVASEHQAEIEGLRGELGNRNRENLVLMAERDTAIRNLEVMRARLQKPGVREAVKAAMRERDFARDGEYLPDDCYEAFAAAALTKVAEMLT